MRDTGLDEAQAGIKIVGRNINNLIYAVEKAMATHSSTLAWKIPWIEEPGGLQRVAHFHFPSPQGCKESDMTEHTHTTHDSWQRSEEPNG